ncbi:hypothetical protein A259_31439 [Pseudomonas syringae pv. actinidiae ICMP 19070]|nr:hypothetical protein A259_31439 [Pseudomonas syringae pv. actinidiae ICMP 19070]
MANIRAGFAPGWIRNLRDALSLCPRQMEALFNASTSTLERRQRQQQPPERAGNWLITRNTALGGHTPLHLCDTAIGSAQVHQALEACVRT